MPLVAIVGHKGFNSNLQQFHVDAHCGDPDEGDGTERCHPQVCIDCAVLAGIGSRAQATARHRGSSPDSIRGRRRGPDRPRFGSGESRMTDSHADTGGTQELATLVKWLEQTEATSVKMVIKPAIPAMLPDQYNSTNSMASYRTQDSFSGVIPAPDGSLNGSSDSWRFKGDDINSINSQNAGSSAYNGGRLSQAMEYTSTASYTSENGTEHHRRESDVSSGARAAAREAAYKAAIEANNAARRAFEESKATAKAQREAMKLAKRATGPGASPLAANSDSLPAHANAERDK
ncbi:hypothetical protein BC830DRAFT_64006 [Chytriomyces sp. MP71]|nr:hypothetical protein BC830DRAFT_64006 [Chytriomyces sp. MP71]